ncbi:MAG: ABC transporter ATP-binding protein [Oscillospiraceae bacterium]|nr:ABC transporter ATP-binding protein [Oscillospiraceae bacterium]
MNRQKSTLRWLSRTAGKDKLHIVSLLLLQSLLGGSSVLYAIFMRSLIDTAVARDRDGMLRSALYLVALVLIQLGMRALVRYLKELCASGLENRFKKRLFSCLLRKDLSAVSAVHSGEWMNRLTSDTVVVARAMTRLLPELGGMVVRLLGALVAIVALEPRFAAILVPGGALLLVLTYAFRKTLKRLHKRIQEADGALRILLQERLGSMLVVRSFGRERRSEELAEERMAAHRDARIRRNWFSNLCNIGFGLVIQGAYVGAAIWCAVGLFRGTMSYGTLMAILQLVGQIQSPFANLSGLVPEYYSMIASAERLMEAESFPEDASQPRPAEEIRRVYEHELISLGLRDACFTYQPPVREEGEVPMPVVLEQLSLQIRKGEFVAFTGHSGSGKSTVLKLLMSLYPLDSGTRFLETASGEQELDAGWRGLFAYVPQGNQLLSGSIREIVAFGDKDAMDRDEEIRRALRIACAESFVDALEKGLDSVLGEGGAGLSEGQMQRIAIARAIFSGRPILLLDEATSSLDAATERRVLENLRSMTDKTVIIVTHRPAALELCDTQIDLAEE